MRFFIFFIFFISTLVANGVRPGLFSWFSASELSFAGGGSLLLNPNARNLNLAKTSTDKIFSTSYIFYPADIQAQSASLLLSISNKVIIGSINHISYGTFNVYDENAIQNQFWFGTYTYKPKNRWGYLAATFYGSQNGKGQYHKNCYSKKNRIRTNA